MNLTRYLAERRRLVDRTLKHVLAQNRTPPRRLDRAMRYSLFSGGKRIRPILALASGEAVGATVERVLPFACALEMIHTYSLIHDDLPAMDDDDLRRGKPTNHIVFGEGMAILAGDGLLTEAFRVMAEGALRNGQNRAAVLRALREIATAAGATGMVGGQVADLEAESKKPTRARVEYIHTRKTAALIRAAVRAGALVGGARPAQFARLDRYGAALGLAFQIADDILDVEGSTDKTGKRAGRDAQLHKVTYPAAVGMDNAKRRARELLDEALEALKPLGLPAEPLRQIAAFIVERAVG
ncbi:MAG: polyprenyl synthetase family protein [Deltaproteobacteria bacterium]|nr:MAG: polyprenyl synthetase family protein [Deltaproteobacteria bacterium]